MPVAWHSLFKFNQPHFWSYCHLSLQLNFHFFHTRPVMYTFCEFYVNTPSSSAITKKREVSVLTWVWECCWGCLQCVWLVLGVFLTILISRLSVDGKEFIFYFMGFWGLNTCWNQRNCVVDWVAQQTPVGDGMQSVHSKTWLVRWLTERIIKCN